MIRDKGILGLSANFEPQVAAPLDARRKVALKADLLLTATWTANDSGVYAHDGMYTVVFGDTPANNGMWILSGTDYMDIGNWEHLSTVGTAVLKRFDTVANAEADTFQTGEICFIEETLGSYYFMPSGSDYTRDGDRYLNTGAAGDTRLVRYTSEYSGDITKDPTGFYEPENVVMSYDSTNRTVTLLGSISAFWRAKQVSALYSGWESTAHDTGDGVYYLYYNGIAFIWSTELWEFDYLHIARVIVSNGETVKFCIRECHGFTYPPTHFNLHQNIGTSRLESSGLLTSYILDSTTAVDRRPDVNLCKLFDEDLETVLPALTSKISYSWWYRTGTDTVNIDNDHDEIINLSANQPYWNENVSGSWQQTLLSNNSYGKIFVLAAPVTSDTTSQKYRYIFIQPQEEYLSYAGIEGVSTLDLDLGGLVDELLEFVFISEIVVQYTAGNWTIKEVNPIEGTRVSQVTVSGSAAALVAQHEAEGTHYLDQIQVPDSRKVGSPLEALSLDKIIDYLWSAGLFDDASWAWTDNLDGTVDIGPGQGMLRVAPTETSELKWLSVSGISNLALIDNSINYIYVDYNAGVPQILTSANRNDFDCTSKCIIYVASREGAAVHRMSMSGSSVDANRKYREKEFDFHRIQVVPGTALLNDEGTRYFSSSFGKFWSINEDILTDLLDTSDTDTYSKYYGSGVTWNKTLGHIQIDNLTYNDGSTTPANLGVGRFSAHFIFIALDEDSSHLSIIVGGSYKNSEDALSSSLPASFPAELGALGVYIGTIVIEQNATEIDDIRIYSTDGISQGAVQTSHSNLPGLQGGSSVDGEFYHLTKDEHGGLVDDLMADEYHRHSELSADDGSPNPSFKVDSEGFPVFYYSPLTSGVAEAGEGIQNLTSALYVQSRGEGLLTNGSGLLENNYNFPIFIFDKTELHGGSGSFLDSATQIGNSTEYIPVNPENMYIWTVWMKAGDEGGGNYDANANQLAGLDLYDTDKLTIEQQHSVKISGSEDTTLAVDLNPDDTTITLADATGWYNGSNANKRSFVWFGYANSFGYIYPDYTYTRNISPTNLWAEGGISGNVITLSSPWAGPALSAGDPVRNPQYGSLSKYFVNKTGADQVWTRYENYIKKATGDGVEHLNDFRAGTAFVRYIFYTNRFSSTNNIRYSDLTFSSSATTYTETVNADENTFIGDEDFFGFVDIDTSSWQKISFANLFAELIANIHAIEYPSFHVHRNSVDQTVASGVETLIDWTTKDAGHASNGFNLSTNRDIPQFPGVYTYTLKAYCIGATLGEVFIRKNGDNVSTGGSNGSYAETTVSSLYMNGTTDYVEGSVKNTGGTAIFGAKGYTNFSGSRTT